MAGRTQRVSLGSMVVVLPWHDPLRVAEEVSMLDAISDGRLILGLGRGAGKVEFDGFRLSMDESRDRFVESAQMLLRGLESGYVEFDGTYIKQPRKAIRPAPFKSFRGRTYAAAVSPESVPIMAELGVGMLIIPAEAVGRGGEGARRVSRGLSSCERRRTRRRRSARGGCSAIPTPAARARWRAATSAATSSPCSSTTSSPAIT